MSSNPTSLAQSFAEALRTDWSAVARPEQLEPPGDWTTWVFCGGRGSGKTRSGSEWIRQRVESGVARWIHLIAPTAGDARDVMLEGPAGILSTASSTAAPSTSPPFAKSSGPTAYRLCCSRLMSQTGSAGPSAIPCGSTSSVPCGRRRTCWIWPCSGSGWAKIRVRSSRPRRGR